MPLLNRVQNVAAATGSDVLWKNCEVEDDGGAAAAAENH